jgi:hypothetical protein
MGVYKDNFGFGNICGPDECAFFCAFFEHFQRQMDPVR